MSIDGGTVRQAMGQFPSGVTIVTTVDQSGRWWGFTASAVTSLSLRPPRVLVCLACSANCYQAFFQADRMAVNVLGAGHEGLARRFATKGIDKFHSTNGVRFEPGELELPVLQDAVAVLECEVTERLPAGDHMILIGAPSSIRVRAGAPAVLYDRRFWSLAGAEAPTEVPAAGPAGR
jgi:flavin reductase ActVB